MKTTITIHFTRKETGKASSSQTIHYFTGSMVSKAGKARAHTAEDCMYGLTHKVEYVQVVIMALNI